MVHDPVVVAYVGEVIIAIVGMYLCGFKYNPLKELIRDVALILYCDWVLPGQEQHETTWARLIQGDTQERLYIDDGRNRIDVD